LEVSQPAECPSCNGIKCTIGGIKLANCIQPRQGKIAFQNRQHDLCDVADHSHRPLGHSADCTI